MPKESKVTVFYLEYSYNQTYPEFIKLVFELLLLLKLFGLTVVKVVRQKVHEKA